MEQHSEASTLGPDTRSHAGDEARPPEDLLGELAEAFLERHRRGEHPAVEEYAAAHSELACEIRRLFPALLMMEDLRPESGDPGGDLATAAGAAPQRLGDYRILREVGRGGMGVVYEAEQESLGRRVALKVLGAQGLRSPRQLLRFHREARAAARLHHTNIVPVFGVGEAEGLHYYVMQLIPGLGLDAVLEEIKRLRGHGPEEVAPAPPAGARAPLAADVVRSLMTGQFTTAPVHDTSADRPAPSASADRPAPSAAAPALALGPRSSVVLPGQSRGSSATDPAGRFARSVALIGVQVAEALDYAHRQGVLHRDIKPSNLLLDGQGTVWVADFGLAKAADSDDLTHTGDIVGTVRYMAPERFEGRCDARSDVYALGLTLYELLARRPAFEKSDRAELIHLVTHTEPPRLRRLEPSVPLDLETVVHKAIDRETERRYPTAAALADDLRRFLDDRAIRARRLSLAHHAWRWCRRNPAAAGLVASVLALVGLAFGGGLWVQRQQLQRRIEAELRRERATWAIEVALGRQEDLRRRGLWEDAKVVLARAETRLDDAGSDELRRRLARAQAELDQAMSAEAEDPGLVLRLAKAEAELGHADRIEALLERAVSRQPRDPDVWKQCGLVRDRVGQTDRAATDFAKAIELLPPDRFFASPRSRLILEMAAHEQVSSRLLELRPDEKYLWIGRGRYHALRGRWRKAAADYARGIESVVTPGTHEYYEYACSLQLLGDETRYRELIRPLGEAVDKAKEPRLAYEVARACIIASKPAVDPARVIHWAQQAVESSPLAWHCHVLGAAYYRAGEYAQAIRWLEDSRARPWDMMGRPLNQFVLAMVHQSMGHAERAVASLEEAVRVSEELESTQVDGAVPPVFAADWMTIQIYRREAELLIKGRATPGDQ
jgi:tetratricopeptide (TPR) repeat protein